jgi:LmbE family N-acetylglucosaminyl deacetylase
VSADDIKRPNTVLAIGAHADDIEFGCGGALAKWAAGGAHVHLAILTDGSKGTWDADADLDTLIKEREAEQAHAAEVLGATAVRQLEFVDGELRNDEREQRRVVNLIRSVRPEVILTHDPWKKYRLHPDHRAAGDLTIAAIVAARDPHFFTDEGNPHRPDALLLFEAEEKDHYERIDEEHFSAKVKALLCHRSQWRSTMGIEPGGDREHEQLIAFVEAQRSEATAAGERRSVPLAEAFKFISPL